MQCLHKLFPMKEISTVGPTENLAFLSHLSGGGCIFLWLLFAGLRGSHGRRGEVSSSVRLRGIQ